MFYLFITCIFSSSILFNAPNPGLQAKQSENSFHQKEVKAAIVPGVNSDKKPSKCKTKKLKKKLSKEKKSQNSSVAKVPLVKEKEKEQLKPKNSSKYFGISTAAIAPDPIKKEKGKEQLKQKNSNKYFVAPTATIVPGPNFDTPKKPSIFIAPTPSPQPVIVRTSIPFASENIKRPIMVARALPQTIIIDQRSAVYPYATLTPYAVSGKGDFLQLDDGSQWKVRHRHYPLVKRWSIGDAIVIETGKYFTWSAYKLVNYTRNETVDVELIESLRSGSLSHWIAEIQPFQGYVRLQDGSIWRMSISELAHWNVNDDVIIALSKDWFSNQCSYVLINPRAKNRLVAIFSFK